MFLKESRQKGYNTLFMFRSKLLILVLLSVIFAGDIYAQKRADNKQGTWRRGKFTQGQGGQELSRNRGGGIGSAVQSPSDVIITMEGGVNGDVLGTNLIHSFTTGASFGSSSGPFQVQSNGITVTGAITMVISTAQAARGTRSMRVNTGVRNHQVLFTLGTSNLVMSYGMAIRLDSGWTGATFASYNFADYHSSDGVEFTTINLFDASPFQFAAQTSLGLSPTINVVTSDINKWLWVTVKWDGTAGIGTIRMYQYIGSGVLGTEYPTSPQTRAFTTTPKYPQGFLFGRPDNHATDNPGSFWYIDDVVLRYDGAFPVLPP